MPSENFTRRELQVLDALCSLPFRSQTEIALDLGIAARTLRSHISTMLAKTGMADQRELVVRELHRRLGEHAITMLSRSGSRRLAVIAVTPAAPVRVEDAIETLKASGHPVFVLTLDVGAILNGLDDLEIR